MLSTDILTILDRTFDRSHDAARRWNLRVEVSADDVGSAVGGRETFDVVAVVDRGDCLVLMCDGGGRRTEKRWAFSELACILRGKNRGRSIGIAMPLASARFADIEGTGVLELVPASVEANPDTGVMTISVEGKGPGTDASGRPRPDRYTCDRIRPFGIPRRKTA